MNPIILIPARMAATRLPGKPLADIGGTAMIVRVWRRAREADLGPVVVAAGNAEIAEAVTAAGGRAVLTDPAEPSGSDRILAALRQMDPEGRHDAIVNLQGDMPFIDPAAPGRAIALLESEPACQIATLAAAEESPADRTNPDVVKAILALDPERGSGRALYFTRSTLWGDEPVWRHIGLYAWRRAALEKFTAAPPSPLERREKLEQLRAMELGMPIHAAIMAEAPLSVDNPADLAAARDYAREHHA
ncbi:MAG: 3-deoxy-manno-octulosonate cytidylyltransferase [Caulobacteraceae bacterium]